MRRDDTMASKNNVPVGEYYIVSRDEDTRTIVIAKVDKFEKSGHQFYDYYKYICSKEEFDSIGVNACIKIEYLDGKKVVKFMEYGPQSIEASVIRLANLRLYSFLKETHGTAFFNRPINISEILDCLYDEMENVDPYIADVVYLLSKAMGLKLAWDGPSFYNKVGFKYPEEVQLIAKIMYDIVSEKLNKGEQITLDLCEFGMKGPGNEEFTKEIEKRSCFCADQLQSDLYYKIMSAKYNSGDGEKEDIVKNMSDLSLMKPVVLITGKEATYYYNILDENAKVEKVYANQSIYNWSFKKGNESRKK